LGLIKRKLVGEAEGGREENGNNKKKLLLLYFYLVAWIVSVYLNVVVVFKKRGKWEQ